MRHFPKQMGAARWLCCVGLCAVALQAGVAVGQAPQGQNARPRPDARQQEDAAPRVGEPAPDLKLRSREGGEMFELSAFRGKRPVLLLFGSYT